MKKFLLVLLMAGLTMPALGLSKQVQKQQQVDNEIPFLSTLTVNGDEWAIGGTITGVKTLPAGNTVRIVIRNGARFVRSGKTAIRSLECTALKKVRAAKTVNPKTSFNAEIIYYPDGENEKVVNAVFEWKGVKETPLVMPVNGYTFNVWNGNKVRNWNTVKCIAR